MEFLMTFERVYNERIFHEGKRKSVIRMVRWNRERPYLERREFHLGDDGVTWIPKKAKGFTEADMAIVDANREKIDLDFEAAKHARGNGALKVSLAEISAALSPK